MNIEQTRLFLVIIASNCFDTFSMTDSTTITANNNNGISQWEGIDASVMYVDICCTLVNQQGCIDWSLFLIKLIKLSLIRNVILEKLDTHTHTYIYVYIMFIIHSFKSMKVI